MWPSENHRITDGQSWKEPPEVIWFNTLSKQGHLERVAQDHIEAAFEDLQTPVVRRGEGSPSSICWQHSC